MQDKELLELAAKAARLELDWQWDNGKKVLCINPHPEDENLSEATVWPEWRPLDDDGDALRLAVKAGLTVSMTNFEVGAHLMRGPACCELYEDHPDRCAAARRAIVRAAAALGQTMS